ncbi:MAG: hypothetical protein U9R11_01645, partial [Chloroflexota bacterium]|nr:hypothetical protein [Chloroflexota bacterium]
HHILRRHGLTKRGKRRKPLYPPLWAWEVEKPFSLIQTDMKDILDKRSFAPTLWDHLRKHKLPRYQTCCVPTLARG